MRYQKILIFGGIGSGKTTLAKKLSEIIKIKTYELDNIAFKDRKNWIRENEYNHDKKLRNLLKNKKWIIEGVYAGDWIIPIVKKADLIIILNIKPSISIGRIISRYLKRKIHESRKETIKDLISLIKYARLYPKEYFLKHKNLARKSKKHTITLESKKEINLYLSEVKQK